MMRILESIRPVNLPQTKALHSFTRLLTMLVRLAWFAAWAALIFVLAIATLSIAPSEIFGITMPDALSSLSFHKAEYRLIWLLGGILFSLGAIFLLSLLHGILATLVQGDPFVPDNARRLQLISLVLTLMEAGRMTLALALQEPVRLYPMPWIAVAILIVLAQVFAEGTALREDRKLTI